MAIVASFCTQTSHATETAEWASAQLHRSVVRLDVQFDWAVASSCRDEKPVIDEPQQAKTTADSPTGKTQKTDRVSTAPALECRGHTGTGFFLTDTKIVTALHLLLPGRDLKYHCSDLASKTGARSRDWNIQTLNISMETPGEQVQAVSLMKNGKPPRILFDPSCKSDVAIIELGGAGELNLRPNPIEMCTGQVRGQWLTVYGVMPKSTVDGVSNEFEFRATSGQYTHNEDGSGYGIVENMNANEGASGAPVFNDNRKAVGVAVAIRLPGLNNKEGLFLHSAKVRDLLQMSNDSAKDIFKQCDSSIGSELDPDRLGIIARANGYVISCSKDFTPEQIKFGPTETKPSPDPARYFYCPDMQPKRNFQVRFSGFKLCNADSVTLDVSYKYLKAVPFPTDAKLIMTVPMHIAAKAAGLDITNGETCQPIDHTYPSVEMDAELANLIKVSGSGRATVGITVVSCNKGAPEGREGTGIPGTCVLKLGTVHIDDTDPR